MPVDTVTLVRAAPLVLVLLLPSAGSTGEVLGGLAFVQDDGTLRIHGRTVHLHGIEIPPTREDCRRFERPARCAPRAALALDFAVDGFVDCEVRARHDDGSITGVCHTSDGPLSERTDLAAYLINRGWAVAAADAPSEYRALERIARRNGLGLWGLPGVVAP